jgi:PAS domain S-box-containing protein
MTTALVTSDHPATKAIRRTVDRLSEVERIAQVGHWERNLATNQVVCSDEVLRICGVAPGAFRPSFDLFLELVHPDDRADVVTAVERAVREGAPYDIIHRVVARDGVERMVHERGTVYRDADGRPSRFVGTMHDITDRAQLARDIKSSAAMLAAILESTADGIMAFDPAGRLLHYNQQLIDMWGLHPAPRPYSDGRALRDRMIELVKDADAVRVRMAQMEADPRATALDRLELRDGRTFERFTCPTTSGGAVIGRVCSFRDVTPQVRVTSELKASEARLAGILKIAGEAIITIDAASRIVLFNQGAEKIFGYAAAEAVGQALEFLLPADARQVLQVADFPANAEGARSMASRTRPIRGRRKNGEEFPAEASITRLQLENEIYFTAILRDITERRRTEAALAESEQRLRQAVRAGQIGIFEHDHETGAIYWSPEARAIYGWTEEQVVTWDRLLQQIHPADRDRFVHAAITAHDPTGDGRFEIEYRAFDTRHALHWLSARSQTTFAGEGQARRPLCTTGAVADITARRRIEELREHNLSLMRATLEATGDGIAVVDREGRIVIYNQLAAEMWGFSAERPVPATVFEAWEQTRDKLIDPDRTFGEARRGLDQPHAPSRHLIHLKDGRIFERYSRPQMLDGEAIGRVLSYRDVTAMHRADEERARLEAQLRQAQKLEAVGTLAGGIAHDFNNILTGIIGYAQLAETHVRGGPTPVECVREITVAARRGAELVQQLLAFSRQQSSERTHVRLSDVVNETVRLVRALFPASIQLRVSLPPISPVILGNATQLQQVLLNLCTNARQAIGAKAGTIDVKLDTVTLDAGFAAMSRVLHAGAYARLLIADNGPGMSDAVKERIFEPFFTTKPPGKGSGLGLAAVHGILRDHEGVITVKSAPDAGAAFHLYFPLVDAPPPAPPATPKRLARGRGKRILLVDDESSLAKAFDHLLGAKGYKVSAYDDPLAAAARFRDAPGKFDAAVLDYAMPALNGLELARQLRTSRPDLPILLLTGHQEAIPETELKRVTVHGILSKPECVSTLPEQLAGIFAGRPSRRRPRR